MLAKEDDKDWWKRPPLDNGYNSTYKPAKANSKQIIQQEKFKNDSNGTYKELQTRRQPQEDNS